MKNLLNIILLLLLLGACNSNKTDNKNNMEEYKTTTLLNTGDYVPSFDITILEGINISMDSLKGKTVFLNFFTLACPMCMKELPKLEEEIWNKYKYRDDIEILTIGREHTEIELHEFYSKKGYSFPMAADTDRSVYSLFADKFVPRNIIIDKTGRIILAKVGYNEKDGLTEIINALEKELNFEE